MDPCYICVTTDIDGLSIYVSDKGTHTITRLSEELEVLQTFRRPRQYRIYGQAAAGGGQLLVRYHYRGKNRLWVLDPGTRQFSELLKKMPEVGVCNAPRVAFCPRLGRVYTNTENTVNGDEYIGVYEIS